MAAIPPNGGETPPAPNSTAPKSPPAPHNLNPQADRFELTHSPKPTSLLSSNPDHTVNDHDQVTAGPSSLLPITDAERSESAGLKWTSAGDESPAEAWATPASRFTDYRSAPASPIKGASPQLVPELVTATFCGPPATDVSVILNNLRLLFPHEIPRLANMPAQPPMYGHQGQQQQQGGHYGQHDGTWIHHQQQQGGHHPGQQGQQGHPGHMNHPHGHPQQAVGTGQNHYQRMPGNNNANNSHGHGQHAGGADHTGNASTLDNLSEEHRRILQWVAELLNGNSREQALMELSKKREQVPELALIIWHSFGVMTCLVQEIISVYPLLNPSQLTAAASNRVCNALALLQCVASHNETRGLFLNAHIPLFLYPFLNTTSKSRPFEYLRLTSLGVIGALVKNDSSEVINFLLTTEIIPLCLRIMETGSELSKTVAIFIVQKILLDDVGLGYICHTYERFYAVGTVLSNMVQQLVEQQTVRLLKHVVRCFLRLSDNARAREALRQCLPEPLRDATFSPVLRDDAATKRCLAQLLINLSDNVEGQPPPSSM